MSDKPVFVDLQTKICSNFLNPTADAVWDALGEPKTPEEARNNIGAASVTYVDEQNAAQNGVILDYFDLAKVYVDDANAAQDLIINSKLDILPAQEYVDAANANQDAIIALKADKTYVDAENAAQDVIIASIVPPEVNDIPVDGATTASISSNWAYDHIAASDPHTGYALESTLGGAAVLNVGTTAGTVAAGNDSRFTIGTSGDAYATSHEADTTAHIAARIVNAPSGNIAATTVQNALNELDSEKAAIAHAHAAADITSGTIATARLGIGTANATTYLRGDQSWQVTAGTSGDAYAVSHEADTTAHPAARIVNTPVGGISATDVQGALNGLDTGKAAVVHAHAGADITSGTVPTARLGGGTADATTYLRGDQTWQVVSGGAATQAFGTIAVSGQTDVVADAAPDTLTLAAGANVTLTTNAATDTITIAAAPGGVTDGDKGDITVSGSGATWTIDAAAVTLAKMANLVQDRIIGRATASTGVPEAITCTAAGRALIDDADATAQRTTLGLGTLATQSGTFSGTSSGVNTGDQSVFDGGSA